MEVRKAGGGSCCVQTGSTGGAEQQVLKFGASRPGMGGIVQRAADREAFGIGLNDSGGSQSVAAKGWKNGGIWNKWD